MSKKKLPDQKTCVRCKLDYEWTPALPLSNYCPVCELFLAEKRKISRDKLKSARKIGKAAGYIPGLTPSTELSGRRIRKGVGWE